MGERSINGPNKRMYLLAVYNLTMTIAMISIAMGGYEVYDLTMSLRMIKIAAMFTGMEAS